MRVAAALAAVLLLPALAGCAPEGLQFRNDDRLVFASPGVRELVSAPVTVRWSMSDFEAVGLDGSRTADRGVFAIFVDRAPMPVGQDLRWLFRDDPRCARTRDCPDADFLADNDVFLTTEPSLVLEQLPQVDALDGEETHDVSVVLLDGTGRRAVESAWYLPFRTTAQSA